jgi:hypothetical protein
MTDTDTLESAPEEQLKIAQHFSAGYEGAAEVTVVQPSLRDFITAPADEPSAEVLGYCRSSLQDSHDGERKERRKASGYSLSSLLVAPARGGRPKRVRRFRREKTAFCWAVVMFVALQLGLTLARESWLPELRDPALGAKMKCLVQRTQGVSERPVTTVMIGSSRTLYGFRGKLLEAPAAKEQGRPVVAFNLGIYGAGPVSELLHLRSLLEKGIRPDLLLVEVPPMFLDDETERDEVGRLPPDRLARDELPVVERYGDAASRGLLANWWRAAAVPVYAHRVVILSELMPLLVPRLFRVECCRQMDDSGWLGLQLAPEFLTPDRRRRTLEGIRKKWTPVMSRLTTNGRGMQALSELLSLAQEERIATAVVLMPEGPVLRSCYPPETWQRVYASLEGLARQFGCPLINAREWVAEEDFSDSHHLLPSGAFLFTERLGRELVLPKLLAQSSAVTTLTAAPECDPD